MPADGPWKSRAAGWPRLVVIGGGARMSAASAARRVAPPSTRSSARAAASPPTACAGSVLPGRARRGRGELLPTRRRSSARNGASTCGSAPGSAGIDPEARRVTSAGVGGNETVAYDALVVASGADRCGRRSGSRPPRVFTIRSLDEAIELRRLLGHRDGSPRHRGGAPGTRPGDGGGAGLRRHRGGGHRGAAPGAGQRGRAGRRAGPGGAGIACGLRLSNQLDAVRDGGGSGRQRHRVVDGAPVPHDLVVIATGVRPLPAAGPGRRAAPAGRVGGRRTELRTSLPDVFAAGDCVALPSGAGPAGLGAVGPRPTRPAGWRAPSRRAAASSPGGRHGGGEGVPTSRWRAPG